MRWLVVHGRTRALLRRHRSSNVHSSLLRGHSRPRFRPFSTAVPETRIPHDDSPNGTLYSPIPLSGPSTLRNDSSSSSRPVSPRVQDEAQTNITSHVTQAVEHPLEPVEHFEGNLAHLSSVLATVLDISVSYSDGDLSRRRCTLTGRFRRAVAGIESGHVLETTAEGVSKDDACYAAQLLFLAKLHELEVLDEEFAGALRIDQRLLAKEDHAHVEVYEYAAYFNLMPDFEVSVADPEEPGARNRLKTKIQIRLPEHGIDVSARASTWREAEVMAAVQFKAKAEEYVALHGLGPISIRDPACLNMDTASDFIAFYKLRYPRTSLQVKAKSLPDFHMTGSIPFRARVTLGEKPIGRPVDMRSAKKAERAALLTAAVALRRAHPDLYPEYLESLKANNGIALGTVPVVRVPLDAECLYLMQETLLQARGAGLSDNHQEVQRDSSDIDSTPIRIDRGRSPQKRAQISDWLARAQRRMEQHPRVREIRQTTSKLPINQNRQQVIDLVNRSTYSIVIGATGSGKTTQVPQILLEKAIEDGDGADCRIVCTQPRRIAATSIARRVAAERYQPVGVDVGYQVRFDSQRPLAPGNITYCTTGVLLSQLQQNSDSTMDQISHLIIDEVHERDILTDFLLILVRRTIKSRQEAGKSVPKVVLMSATMDAELFAQYFRGEEAEGAEATCPSINVPGRTFPVERKYLDEVMKELVAAHPSAAALLESDASTREYLDIESAAPLVARDEPVEEEKEEQQQPLIDWRGDPPATAIDGAVANSRDEAVIPFGLIALTVAHIAKTTDEGAILVFLPGLDEILRIEKMLLDNWSLGLRFGDPEKFHISLLHSTIPHHQIDVFKPLPAGCRKIILATNLAETSVTIPDVQYVVDAGKQREEHYDHERRILRMACGWISKSSSKQRAGRAGRVRNGHYLALFPERRYDALRDVALPEILRSNLQTTCLDIKSHGLDVPIRDFLAEAMNPPPMGAVDAAIRSLQDMGALTEDEGMTALGRVLSRLPVVPSMGRMILLGIVFRCLDPMLILAAASSERGLFVAPVGSRQRLVEVKRGIAGFDGGDHMAVVNVVRELRRKLREQGMTTAQQWARESYVNYGVFQTILNAGQQMEGILSEAGLIPRRSRAEMDSSLFFGHADMNENSAHTTLIQSLTVAGFHPNLAVQLRGPTFRTRGERRTIIHGASVNTSSGRREGAPGAEDARGSLVVFSQMATGIDGKSLFLRETTRVPPLVTLLFGGRLINHMRRPDILTMDDWLSFYIAHPSTKARALKTVIEYRKALDRLLGAAFRDLFKPLGEETGRPQAGEGGTSQPRQGTGTGQRAVRPRYLADEPARIAFASGLVHLLDHLLVPRSEEM